MRRYWCGILVLLIINTLTVVSQKLTRAEYIANYSDIAVKEMQRTGIPASITLAQGILESGDGNSRLALDGNNHFGIKCHRDWQGKKMYHDDDARNECFRKYNSAFDSYRDHSDFLTSKPRYQFLFELELTDYKAWARGLKKAGYATSRTYDRRLIELIEANQLYKYDDPKYATTKSADNFEKKVEENMPSEIHLNNNIKYVFAKKGDNIDIIAQRYGKLPFEIARYNEIERTSKITEGQMIYLQPKRTNAARDVEAHIVKDGDTMYSISQLYGIKLKSLYTKNQLVEGDKLSIGQELILRGKNKKKREIKIDLPSKPAKKIIKEEEEKEEQDFTIEFDG